VRSGVIAFGAVAGLGAANGGFFPSSWGPAVVLLAWAALVALLVARPATFPVRGTVYFGLACAVAGWTALGAAWTTSTTSTILEAERALVVVAALAAILVSLDRRWTLRGVVAAVALLSVWNLLSRHGSHLSGANAAPVGYANALGALAAVAILLALRERITWPALVVLVPELAVSGSRGGLVALALGLLIGLVRRPVLVVPAAALVLALGWVTQGPRHEYYRVAVDEIRAAPVIGTGAGTWDEWWLQHRPTPNSALDAHSVYLETFGEEGLAGLALLCALLAVPLAGRPRDRLALAAYAAFVIHAAVDWDREMPALWVAGLVVGGALLPAERVQLGARRTWSFAVALLALGALGALSGVAQISLSRAQDAARVHDLARTRTLTRRAARFEPWSSRPLLVLGEAQADAGDRTAASATFRKALAKDPASWQLWHDLAEASGSRRAGDEARRLNPLGG
jgi:hypothetical protein